MEGWLPISHPSGYDQGWIKPEMVVQVSPGSGQRCITWKDANGQLQQSCRAFNFDDGEFMRRLGLVP